MSGGIHVDAMYFRIAKVADTAETVDYAFMARVSGAGPHNAPPGMENNEVRGLLRIDKRTLEVELVSQMWGDDSGRRATASAHKVLKEYRQSGIWPEQTYFACG